MECCWMCGKHPLMCDGHSLKDFVEGKYDRIDEAPSAVIDGVEYVVVDRPLLVLRQGSPLVDD